MESSSLVLNQSAAHVPQSNFPCVEWSVVQVVNTKQVVCLSNMFQEETHCEIHTILLEKGDSLKGTFLKTEACAIENLERDCDWEICWGFWDMVLVNSCVPKVLELIYCEARQCLLKRHPHFMKNMNFLFLQDPRKIAQASDIVQPQGCFLVSN